MDQLLYIFKYLNLEFEKQTQDELEKIICLKAESEKKTIDIIYAPNDNKIKIYEIFFSIPFYGAKIF